MKNQYPTPLRATRLVEAMATLDIHWMQDPTGFLVAPFRLGNEDNLVITYEVDGDDDILVMRGTSSARFEPDEFPRVIALLNTWHDQYRWPTASLDVAEAEPRVVASFQVYLPAGVTEAQLTGFVAAGTDTIIQFHRWLADQHRSIRARAEDLVSSAELEEWFRRAA